MPREQRKQATRYEGNPIICTDDIPFRCNTVFNAGAAKVGDEYVLLLRIELLDGRSCLGVGRSKDGYHFEIADKPVMMSADYEPFKTYEARGVEDPRVTEIDGEFFISYTAYSKYGPRLGLAKTKDFRNIERICLASQVDNKDAVLFPEKIGGRYARLDRPVAFGGGKADIWISYSEDLCHWGSSQVVMEARGGYWDHDRIGAAAPPIKTEQGWLEIYHGVKEVTGAPIYRLGAVLLDLEDPSKVVGRSDYPILSPREIYERVGDVFNVVFSCGGIVERSGEVRIYYGAADTCICLATMCMDDLLSCCTE